MHLVRLPRLRKAAALGDAVAQYELGNYLIPDSGEISREVLKWYRLAAENGQMDAHGMLANFYATGNSVDFPCTPAG